MSTLCQRRRQKSQYVTSGGQITRKLQQAQILVPPVLVEPGPTGKEALSCATGTVVYTPAVVVWVGAIPSTMLRGSVSLKGLGLYWLSFGLVFDTASHRARVDLGPLSPICSAS